MKIAVTPHSVNSIEDLAKRGAQIFIIGNDRFANRLTKSYTDQEAKAAVEVIKKLKKEVYISLNLIIHNSDLTDVSNYLDEIKNLNVDGIVFGDLSVYNLAKKMQMEHLLIYNPETLNTNFYDPEFWSRKGIKGITISKEITLNDIEAICEKSDIEISLIGHGHLNMFHSRRPLIENFFKYNKEEYDKYLDNRNLHLVEEIRNEAYPVFQDNHGTHIFRDKIMESYKEINELQNSLDVFIIDSIFKDDKYLSDTVSNYRVLMNKFHLEKATKISNKYKKDHDSGFLFKKTVYDKY